MLLTISTGKKPTGAAHRPSPTAMALAGYLLTLTAATTLTLRRLAAEIDRDARSCRTAAEQLIAFGVEGLTWADADTLTYRPTTLGAADIRPAESVPVQTWDVPVESWEEEFLVEREPVDEQLSLFGGAAPVRPEPERMTMAASAVRRPAAVDIDVETDDESDAENPGVSGADPVKTRMGGFVLDDGAANIDVDPANLAQSLHKPCTEIVQDVQKAGHGALAAAMERLAATLDGKPGNISAHADAPAPTHAPASKEKQEINLNQSTNVNQEALNHEFKLLIAHPKIVPRFDAAERERRIAEIREKVPDAAEHVVGAAGQYQNCPSASYMPFESIYGAECRGGSWPSRFESDARKRGLNAVSVTGSATYEWMRWAVINGRWAACGCGTAHFQTVVGYDDAGTPEDEDDDSWYVWNCNDVDRAPDTIYKYTDREFKRLHRASGEWCIVLVNIATRPEYPRWKVK